MRRKPRIIAIDFDGVIADHNEPMPGARNAMQEIVDQGYRLVVHTLRARTPSGRSFVITWLNLHDMPYHEVTAVKPDALLFIDDRAYRFTNWVETLTAIELYDPLSVLK